MKKLTILVALTFLVTISNAQTAKDFFNSTTKVTWLGIDYSNAQLVGDFAQIYGAGSQNTDEVKDKYFPAWNNLFFTERDKYNLNDMLRNNNIAYEIDMVMKLNDKANSNELRSYKPKTYSKDDIKSFVRKYPLSSKRGIGVVLVTESLNKEEKLAFYHFVVLDMRTKKVLFQERLVGKPGGFGLRNYWAGSINNVIKDITKVYFKQWGNNFK